MADEDNDYFLQNEKKLNQFAFKYFALACIFPYIILLMVVLGLFNYSLPLAITTVVFSTVITIIFYCISRLGIYASAFKYFLCLSVQVVIFFYSFDCDMNITIMLMMAPLIALLYFNPKLEIIICISAIISMIAGIIIQAPETVEKLYPGVSPFMFVLTTGGTHLAEMIGASVVLVTVTIIARKLMNKVDERNTTISSIQKNLVYSFADMIESRDGTTGEHVKRTSQVVGLIVNEILKHPERYNKNISEKEYQYIVMSAPMHDIGKIKVPDRILSKPGKLTDEEFEIIKTHSLEGAKIINKTMKNLEDPDYVKIAHDMALYHHEKWNGQGYPEGLSGEHIPVCARIMAVADVFDALCSKRSYKEAFTIDKAYEIMNESKGVHFEPALVDFLNDLKPEMQEIYS